MSDEKKVVRTVNVEFEGFTEEEVEIINYYLVHALCEAKRKLEGDN